MKSMFMSLSSFRLFTSVGTTRSKGIIRVFAVAVPVDVVVVIVVATFF